MHLWNCHRPAWSTMSHQAPLGTIALAFHPVCMHHTDKALLCLAASFQSPPCHFTHVMHNIDLPPCHCTSVCPLPQTGRCAPLLRSGQHPHGSAHLPHRCRSAARAGNGPHTSGHHCHRGERRWQNRGRQAAHAVCDGCWHRHRRAARTHGDGEEPGDAYFSSQALAVAEAACCGVGRTRVVA